MSESKTYPVSEAFAKNAFITNEQYIKLYEQSISDPDTFWSEQAEKFITWFKKWDTVQDCNYDDVSIKWFLNGKLNVSYNCLDRHLQERGDQIAIIWEGDEPDVDIKITYKELHEQVCRFANVLKDRGVKKG